VLGEDYLKTRPNMEKQMGYPSKTFSLFKKKDYYEN
jgi:hypothetical protein